MRSAAGVVKRALARGDTTAIAAELTNALVTSATGLSGVAAARGAPHVHAWAHSVKRAAGFASSGVVVARGVHVGASAATAAAAAASTRAAARGVRDELLALRSQAARFCADGGKKSSGGWEHFKPKAGTGKPAKPGAPGDPESVAKRGSRKGESGGGGGGSETEAAAAASARARAPRRRDDRVVAAVSVRERARSGGAESTKVV